MRYPEANCIACGAVTDKVILIDGDRYWHATTLENLGVADGPAAVSAASGVEPGRAPAGRFTNIITICPRCCGVALLDVPVYPAPFYRWWSAAPVISQPF